MQQSFKEIVTFLFEGAQINCQTSHENVHGAEQYDLQIDVIMQDDNNNSCRCFAGKYDEFPPTKLVLIALKKESVARAKLLILEQSFSFSVKENVSYQKYWKKNIDRDER